MRRLVILLHGVNARGRDVAQIARAWHLPDTVVVAPDAPLVSDENPDARMWFSLQGITRDTRPARVRAARPAFDALIAQAVAAQGLTGHLERVAFVGFSQGAIMALDAVASGRWPVGAVVAASGRFATEDIVAPQTPALILHGDADTAVPPDESTNAVDCLRAAGCPAQLVLLSGMAHCIAPEAAARAGTFLRDTLIRGRDV